MIPIINANIFENPFYTITSINQPNAQFSYIDFVISPSPANPSPNNWGPTGAAGGTYSTISPTVMTKFVNVKKLVIPINPQQIETEDPLFLYNIIKNEINKDFFNRTTILGEQHRNLDLSRKFDIIIREMKKTTQNIGRTIISKLISTSNFIAIQGRIGPAHWCASNGRTYKFILSYIQNEYLTYNQDMQPMILGNAPFIINDSIDDEIILIGRKNNIDQPGVHCFILVNEQKNLEFQEISIGNHNNNIIMYYALEEFGNQPYAQYFKINTENLTYQRYKKLKKIENL